MNAEMIQAWAGIAAAIISAVGTVFLFLTLRETGRAATAAAKFAAEELAIGRSAADAALAQVAAAQDASRRQLQPYLLAFDPVFELVELAEKKRLERNNMQVGTMSVTFSVKNFGVTPATNFMVMAALWQAAEGHQEDVRGDPQPLGTVGDLGPGEGRRFTVSKIVDLTTNLALKSSQYDLVLSGTTFFDDAHSRYRVDWDFRLKQGTETMEHFRGGNRTVSVTPIVGGA
ncbi:MAG: hypothetical protein EON90_02000 [Brevundimonas sp.]|nr:MAG: hypothetical protein EON90_02000 [Brevundimonas sp.]